MISDSRKATSTFRAALAELKAVSRRNKARIARSHRSFRFIGAFGSRTKILFQSHIGWTEKSRCGTGGTGRFSVDTFSPFGLPPLHLFCLALECGGQIENRKTKLRKLKSAAKAEGGN